MAAKKSSSGRKYGKAAGKSVKRALHKEKRGTLKSGSGRKVTSREQAIAIGLSEARAEGAKVPSKRTAKKGGAKKGAAKKGAAKKGGARKGAAKKGGARKSAAKKGGARKKTSARKKTAKRGAKRSS
jgi:hypothetical protein